MHQPLLQEGTTEPRRVRAAPVVKTLLALCALAGLGGWLAPWLRGGKSCNDFVPPGQTAWYDSAGFNCTWYSQGGRCGDGDCCRNFEHTANDACCACGGSQTLADLQADLQDSLFVLCSFVALVFSLQLYYLFFLLLCLCIRKLHRCHGARDVTEESVATENHIHDCGFDPKVDIYDEGGCRTVRVECPGVRSKDIEIEEKIGDGVYVTITKAKAINDSLVQAANRICQTHGQWKKGFSFDGEPYVFNGNSKHEDGVLYLYWEAASRSRKFRIGGGLLEEEEQRDGMPTRKPFQSQHPRAPRQPRAADRLEDGSSEVANSVADDNTSEISSFLLLHDVGSRDAAGPAEKPKCYLPNYGFKSPDGNILLTQMLKEGDTVLGSDGSEASVASVQKFEYNKSSPYNLVSLSTAQGTFEVSAGHRVALPGGRERCAHELVVGNQVMVGKKVQRLVNVVHKEMRTDLYSVLFEPDCSIEAFPVWKFGLQTKGEASNPPQDRDTNASDIATGLELLQLVGLSHVTAEELARAQPGQYED